jgi:hypothetical protein
MPIVYVIAALVALSFISLGDTAAKIIFEVSGLRFRGFAGLSPVLEVNISLANPSRQAISIGSMIVNISVAGQLFAQIAEPAFSARVQANAKTIITLPVSISTLDLPLSLKKLILAGKIPNSMEFAGNIRVNGVLVPFKTSYSSAF